MSDVHDDAGYLQVIFHDDDETPIEFVMELLHSVFKKPIFDAMRFTEGVRRYGDAVCDIYPRDVGNELLEAARQHIRASAHPLRITSKAVVSSGAQEFERRCKLCGTLSRHNRIFLKGIRSPRKCSRTQFASDYAPKTRSGLRS